MKGGRRRTTNRHSSRERWKGGYDQSCALVGLFPIMRGQYQSTEIAREGKQDEPEALSCVRKTCSPGKTERRSASFRGGKRREGRRTSQ